MRYYRAIDPRLAREAQSFALLRDPVDRFASAYAFVKSGCTPTSRLSAVFAAFLQSHGIRALPWLNRAARMALYLSPRQLRHIEALYAQDFDLIESVRAFRYARGEPWTDAFRPAAE